MSTIQFLSAVLDWLLADPAHLVVAASVIAALTPTPDPASILGKLYRVVDLLALNILRAKDPGAAKPVPPTAADTPAPAQHSRQAGFARGPAALLVLVAGAALATLLSGCAGMQTAFATINAGAVQAASTTGKDQIAVGRELLCNAPYQTVANAMAEDSGMAAAVPGLCPATRSVAVSTVAPATAPAAAH